MFFVVTRSVQWVNFERLGWMSCAVLVTICLAPEHHLRESDGQKMFLLIAIYDVIQMKVCGAPVATNESFQLPVLFIASWRDSSRIGGA